MLLGYSFAVECLLLNPYPGDSQIYLYQLVSTATQEPFVRSSIAKQTKTEGYFHTLWLDVLGTIQRPNPVNKLPMFGWLGFISRPNLVTVVCRVHARVVVNKLYILSFFATITPYPISLLFCLAILQNLII